MPGPRLQTMEQETVVRVPGREECRKEADLLIAHCEDVPQGGQICDGVLIKFALTQQVPEVLAEDLCRCESRLQPQAPHHTCREALA